MGSASFIREVRDSRELCPPDGFELLMVGVLGSMSRRGYVFASLHLKNKKSVRVSLEVSMDGTLHIYGS